MKLALVDTNVVSMLFKRDTRAIAYEEHTRDRFLAISFMTLAELDEWVIIRNWGTSRRAELAMLLQNFTVLFPDRDLCIRWAKVKAEARRIGRPIETADAWIDATALLYGVPLITHNRSDFEAVDGLVVISES